MHQVVKGKEWHFGMKAHVGTDPRGIVHTLRTTAANAADINQMHELLQFTNSEHYGHMEELSMDIFKRAQSSSCLMIIVCVLSAFVMKPRVVHSQAIAAEGASQVVPESRVDQKNVLKLPTMQEANCKRLEVKKTGPLYEQCQRVRQILAIMSAEPRAAWANSLEEFLQKWVQSLEYGFTFRSVGCRLSWCFVEAGSTVGAGDIPNHDTVLDLHQAKKMKLYQTETMFAPDAVGSNVSDVLILFKRYCGSRSELFDGDSMASDFYTLGQTCGS